MGSDAMGELGDDIIIPEASDEDRVAYRRLQAMATEQGAARTATEALDSDLGFYSLALFLAAQGAEIEVVMAILRLRPGDLAKAIDAAHAPEQGPSCGDTSGAPAAGPLTRERPVLQRGPGVRGGGKERHRQVR